jgi:hypothetical protein
VLLAQALTFASLVRNSTMDTKKALQACMTPSFNPLLKLLALQGWQCMVPLDMHARMCPGAA